MQLSLSRRGDPRDIGPEAADKHRLHFPKVAFEILPLTTARRDRVVKAAEYQALRAVAAVVLVDLTTDAIELHERTGPAAWTQREVARGEDLILADPPLTLTAAEIFGDG